MKRYFIRVAGAIAILTLLITLNTEKSDAKNTKDMNIAVLNENEISEEIDNHGCGGPKINDGGSNICQNTNDIVCSDLFGCHL